MDLHTLHLAAMVMAFTATCRAIQSLKFPGPLMKSAIVILGLLGALNLIARTSADVTPASIVLVATAFLLILRAGFKFLKSAYADYKNTDNGSVFFYLIGLSLSIIIETGRAIFEQLFPMYLVCYGSVAGTLYLLPGSLFEESDLFLVHVLILPSISVIAFLVRDEQDDAIKET